LLARCSSFVYNLLMARCIFHLDLDAFFASVEQVRNPRLKGKPVVVGGDPERRGVVSSASYEARPFGIHAAMPLSQARRLCPQAIFLPVDIARYQEASDRFMKILSQFSPVIEPLGLDEAYLDVSQYWQPHRSPARMARAIKERITGELGLTVSVGIATCKVVAKIASDLRKPDGLVEVAPGKEGEFLAPLPTSRLPGVGQKTEQALKEIGITTIGELASSPRERIMKTFGAMGIVLHNYANGIDPREVEEPGEAKSISRQVTFARDTLDQRFLESSLQELCRQVCLNLRSSGKQAGAVTIRLRYADFSTVTRQTSLMEASDAAGVIFATALPLLNKTLKEKGKLVRLIGVRVSSLTGREKQLSLFDSRGQKRGHLEDAIATIRRKYGKKAIREGRDTSS